MRPRSSRRGIGCARAQIKSVHINWKEDVRVWHPGQGWIWEPGGLGVFDPGINALSILTRILPQPVFVTAAELAFPANCQAPIAANLTSADIGGLPITAEFDFRQTGPQSWDILVETDAGPDDVVAAAAGAWRSTARPLPRTPDQEYRELYRRFVEAHRDRRARRRSGAAASRRRCLHARQA